MFIAKLDRLSKYLQKNTRMFEFTKKTCQRYCAIIYKLGDDVSSD